MSERKNLHPEAGAHFGIFFDGGVSEEERIKNAFESLKQVPMFNDLAGPGDHQLAADLLIQGTTQALVRLLDFVMLAKPSFNNPAAHALFAMELAKVAGCQLDAAAESLTYSASYFVGRAIAELPEERQREIYSASRDRTMSHIQQLFEGLLSGDKPERSN